METFTELKEFVNNPKYLVQRQKNLSTIVDMVIDKPIIDTINSINKLPYCFTLQCCYGHFVCNNNKDIYNIEPLSTASVNREVEYRIAYIALCIENNKLGKEFFNILYDIPKIDPSNIQFGCAEWFWQNQVNSYVLQVAPNRHKNKDKVKLNFREAENIEKVRNKFFIHLSNVLEIINKNG